MRLTQVFFLGLVAVPLAFNVGCSESSNGGTGGTGGAPPLSYAGNLCVGAKQVAAGAFCKTTFDTWAAWETDQDDSARDAAIEAARMTLGRSWDDAESNAELAGANCSDLALPSSQAADDIEAWGSSIVSSINDPFLSAQETADLMARTSNPKVAALILRGGGHIGFAPYNRSYFYSLITNFFDPKTGAAACIGDSN